VISEPVMRDLVVLAPGAEKVAPERPHGKPERSRVKMKERLCLDRSV